MGDSDEGLLDHSLPIRIADYDNAVQAARSTRTSLESFRNLYDRHLEALKWVSAFSIAGLYGVLNTAGSTPPAVVRPIVAAAGIAFLASLIGALAFYERFLTANSFIHTAEVRLGELDLAFTRLTAFGGDTAPAPVVQRMNAAAKSVEELPWPDSVRNHGDQAAWKLCLAGFLVGISIVGGLELAILFAL